MNKLKVLLGFVPKLKQYIFADGVFKKDRAIILMVSFIMLLVAIQIFGIDKVLLGIDLLDDLSDILGYSG